jgi:hypothetical protein
MSLHELVLSDEDRDLLRRLVGSLERLAAPAVLVSERARQVYRDIAQTEEFSGTCPTCGQTWCSK